ncbi:threonine-phosphate decarboxylase CobD [Pseudoponticoccus marisrubri]|uniref:threonine-phosphate decarboxylase n=1 Tax=Pseudoponticoccus marisrubri TaxID=1685382 RepID=A0A0W7WPF6_9RHOB|nr:threonine-phosphate decarboxylase CobD [Pseudoponticoccus marisrubri]KUF12417.1 threonine-phosphate decarboxylase [Pseudoponticoccus marisrubri]
MRDHGGDLDRARSAYGGTDWLDLSTGINPVPYPMPALTEGALGALPLAQDVAALEGVARSAFGGGDSTACLAMGGASAAIQLVPRLARAGGARVLGPTYNEHAAALRAEGWHVQEVATLAELAGAELAVVVNPNNPDGRCHDPDALQALARKVGLLVVDESFADSCPALSLVPRLEYAPRAIVLRSFGKFYGLAGLRLGFALGAQPLIDALRRMAGPWAVSGPAIAAGRAAYADRDWQEATTARLTRDAARLDGLAARAGWALVGGTPLFRTYATPDARAAKDGLARHHVWSRIFPYSETWLRLGLPGQAEGWARLDRALTQMAQS